MYVRLYSLIDIATNKLLALFSRATFRDFIDVYKLVTEGFFSKDVLIEKAREKDPGFDLYWLGVAFERIKMYTEKTEDMFLLIKKIPFHDLLVFYKEWTQEITEKIK